MIITDSYIILHFPKMGGTWMRTLHTQYAPKEIHCIDTGIHLSSAFIPYDKKNLPVAVVVRNPLDWYVSGYFFVESGRTTNRGYFSKPKEERNDYVIDWWERELAYGLSVEGFQKHLPKVLEKNSMGRNFFNYIADAKNINFIRFENLRDDLISFLKANSALAHTALEPHIKTFEALNKSEHLPFMDYYTPELLDMVFKYERDYINRFSYTFSRTKQNDGN